MKWTSNMWLYCFVIFSSIWIPYTIGQVTTKLPRKNINRDFITMSGFSSGGTMAQHMFISYSSLIHGIGIFSHTHYRCGPGDGNITHFSNVCTSMKNAKPEDMYNVQLALTDISSYAKAGLIENPTNLFNKPLYIWIGTVNFLFSLMQSMKILNVFEPFIINHDVIRTRVQIGNWTLPSDRKDLPDCSAPFNTICTTNCGFSGPLDALQHLLGTVAIKKPRGNIKLQPLLQFDQTEFFFGYGGGKNHMDSIGFVYIPKICKDNKVKCLLHFYFDGCRTGREFVGDQHALNSGFLQVAEANGIIVVFPQKTSDTKLNAFGCWDTFGLTGTLYATKRGTQVTIVKNMIDRLLGNGDDDDDIDDSEYIKYPTPPRPVPSSDPKRRCTVSEISPKTSLKRCVSI